MLLRKRNPPHSVCLSPPRLLLACTILVLRSFVASAQHPIRILAFGDSLTEGLTNHGAMYHPYTINLKQELVAAGKEVEVVNKGVSGERVLLTMKDRLSDILREEEAEGKMFQWCIIHGGINDIGLGSHGPRVFGGLKALYEICTEHGAKIVAMTIMETSADTTRAREQCREELSSLIREHAEKRKEKFALVDLERLIPYHGATAEEKTRLWDDGLHLSPSGYDLMGKHIADVLKQRLA